MATVYKPIINPQGSTTDNEQEVLISADSIMLNNKSTVQEEISDIFSELCLQKKQLNNLKKIIGKNLPVPAQIGSLEYNGTPQKPSWSNYEENVFCYISGQTYGVNAGTYVVTFTLADEEFRWADGTTDPKEVAWTINRQKILDFPVQKTPYPSYTGDSIVPEFDNLDTSKIRIVSGTIKSETVGSHTMIIAPGNNFAWSDGSTDQRPLSWQIKGSTTLVSNPSLQMGSFLYYNGNTQYPTFNYDSVALQMTGETSGVAAGNYTAVFTPKEGYDWSEDPKGTAKSVPWTINSAVIKKK